VDGMRKMPVAFPSLFLCIYSLGTPLDWTTLRRRNHRCRIMFCLYLPHTHSPTHSLTHPPTHSPTHSLNHSLTHSLTHSPCTIISGAVQLIVSGILRSPLFRTQTHNASAKDKLRSGALGVKSSDENKSTNINIIQHRQSA
jgi:hypothetical protein